MKQLTLGELINKLKTHPPENRVYLNLEYVVPTGVSSYRGYYDELAINFEMDKKPLTVKEFIAVLDGAVGNTYEGYKGGSYRMDRHTPVWLANYGNSGGTRVTDVYDDTWGSSIICFTKQGLDED